MTQSKIKIGIIGAGGYTGQELAAVLAEDEFVEIAFLNSASLAGKKSKFVDLKFENLSKDEMLQKKVDVLFYTTPNGVAMKEADFFLSKNVKIIDLSADFRFLDTATFEKVYKIKHSLPDKRAVFGLTEIFSEKLKNAELVANPGCYVTSCLLAAWPIKDKFSLAIFDSKSGFSGAGKNFPLHEEVKKNIIPYKLANHRHQAEIQQFIDQPIHFTPHILPTFRGLETTAHFILNEKDKNLDFYQIFKDFYNNFPHVEIQKEIPTLNDVKTTNNAVLGGFEIDNNGRLVIVSVLDNLRKGAVSQAVQNLHAMFSLPPEVPEPKKFLEF
jgi:N-acetyl-gamma-glutamyl-phosphate reductase